jgi:hypothetical protein
MYEDMWLLYKFAIIASPRLLLIIDFYSKIVY